MTAELARALIRYAVETDLEKKSAKRSVRKMRLILGNDCSGSVAASDGWPDCFVTFWMLIKKPRGGKEIILREAKGVVLAHILGGGYGNIGGSTVQTIANVQTTATSMMSASDTASMLSGGARKKKVTSIYNQLDEAWRAGVWDSAVNTRQEFSIGLDYMIVGGAAALMGTRRIRMQMWYAADKSNLLSLMGAAERKGRWSEASRKHVRDLCVRAAYLCDPDSNAIHKVAPKYG
jgi:hypothetical protein